MIGDDSPMVENLLKFCGSLHPFVGSKVCLSSHVDGSERNPLQTSQFVACSRLKQADGIRWIIVAQRNLSADCWKEVELNDRVIGIAFRQIVA